MVGNDTSERFLHDRATRGEELTPVEQVASSPSTSAPASLSSLRHEVDAALAQLRTATRPNGIPQAA